MTTSLEVTWWPDLKGVELNREDVPWNALVNRLASLPQVPAKEAAPLVKLATFGLKRTPAGSLRSDENVVAVSGIEGDYDAGKVTLQDACKLLEQHHLKAVVLTTWNHTAEHPRWRVFAPLSQSVAPAERRRLCAALNGILGGILASESFALSQSYFVGPPLSGEYLVLPTFDDPEEGECLDRLDAVELARLEVYPPNTNGSKPHRAPVGATSPSTISSALLRELEGPGKAGKLWREGKDGGGDRSRNDAALAATLAKLGFPLGDIEAAVRAYPLGQVGQGVLGKAEADRQIARLLGLAKSAQRNRRDDGEGVQVSDFWAYMPSHSYIFAPTGEHWPAASVNSRLGKVQVLDEHGQPKVGGDGKPLTVAANVWLDEHRAVEQTTWMPGEPQVIENRLMTPGGSIERPGCRTFNQYRPPTIEWGEPAKAGPWLEHVRKIYPESADHLVRYFAHRVQQPAEKINHALVLGGAQGTGKDSMIQGVVPAIGAWNVAEVSPDQLLGRFNGFIKSVLLRVSEARDLGDTDRYRLYEHLKTFTAAPPEMLRCDEKHLREYMVPNVTGCVITSNHRDGIYLPADDRRHFVAWTDLTKEAFTEAYWRNLYGWYETGGYEHVAAYLATLDLSDWNPKAPPPKTAAWWAVVDAGRAPEDAELADALDKLGNPEATTLKMIACAAESQFSEWMNDRKNARQVSYRMEAADYTRVRNESAKDGLFKAGDRRQAIYARRELSTASRLAAATRLIEALR